MEYLLFLQNLREMSPSFLNEFFVIISEGLVTSLIILPAIVYWCCNKQVGKWMLLNYSTAYMTNQLVKNTACVYRPWIRNPEIQLAPEAIKSATGYSFPSGHTTIAASVMESFIVWQKKRKLVVFLCSFVILMVAFARNWLGAHTQYDVLASIIETSIVVILNILIVSRLDGSFDNIVFEKPLAIKKDLVILVISICVVFVLMLYLQFKPYPIDYNLDGKLLADPYDMLTDCYTGAGLVCGFFAGWIIERRFIDFKEDVSKKQKILRGIVGVLFFSLLYFVVLPLILLGVEEHLKHFIKYFVIMIMTLAGYPALFTQVEKSKR